MTFKIHFIYCVGIIHLITYLSFIQSEKLFDTRVINKVIFAKIDHQTTFSVLIYPLESLGEDGSCNSF